MKDKILTTILISVMLLSSIHFHQILSSYNQTRILLQATGNQTQVLPPLMF